MKRLILSVLMVGMAVPVFAQYKGDAVRDKNYNRINREIERKANAEATRQRTEEYKKLTAELEKGIAELNKVMVESTPVLRETLEFSLASQSGNTEGTSIEFDDTLELGLYNRDYAMNFGAYLSNSDGETNEEEYWAGFKTQRDFWEFIGAYHEFEWTRNRFIGIRSKYNVENGFTFKLIDWVKSGYPDEGEKITLNAGMTYIYEDRLVVVDKQSPSAVLGLDVSEKLLGSYRAFFQNKTYFDLADTENIDSNTELGLTANLSKYVSWKIAYQIKYRNAPVEGSRNTDKRFTLGLTMTWE